MCVPTLCLHPASGQKALADAGIQYSDIEQACVGYVYGKIQVTSLHFYSPNELVQIVKLLSFPHYKKCIASTSPPDTWFLQGTPHVVREPFITAWASQGSPSPTSTTTVPQAPQLSSWPGS